MRKIPKRRFLDVAGMILRNKMAKEAIYPFYCSFKLTRRCNFTCSFCNCWHVKNKWVDMPTEDVKAVLDNLARSSVIVCSFEGGDPLVRDDILELLKYQYEKPWYLLFTTSERDMQQRYPMAEYGKYIDFLHISIDEGHKNLDMYDELEEYTKWGSIVTVQIVVTKNDIGALEQKIKRCQDAGVNAVLPRPLEQGQAAGLRRPSDEAGRSAGHDPRTDPPGDRDERAIRPGRPRRAPDD